MKMRQNYRMSNFIISRFNTYMFYQIKRTALLEFIPLVDVNISIGTAEHKADIKDSNQRRVVTSYIYLSKFLFIFLRYFTLLLCATLLVTSS